MYSVEIVPHLLIGAEKYVLENERMIYRPYFEAAEKFIAEKDGVIGGKVGIDLLVGAPLTSESFMWDIYIDNTYENAKELTRLIYSTKSHLVPSETAEMRTVLKHREFVISVNARALFNIFTLDKYRGVRLVEVMQPVQRNGYFTSTPLDCVPEYMQMEDIYHTLYSPAKSGQWEYARGVEKSLVGGIKEGGGEGKKHRPNVGKAMSKLTSGHFSRSDDVIIGSPTVRLQFLSATPAADIATKFSKILGENLIARQYPIGIPSDFQLTKHTIYAGEASICDVFNSPTYELIPYTVVKGVRHAHPFVSLRFIYIDIWLMKILAKIRPDMAEFAHDRAQFYMKTAAEMRIDVPEITTETLFAGIHTDARVAKKKLVKETGAFFPNYYPAKERIDMDVEENVVEEEKIVEGGNEMGWKQRMIHELVGIPYASEAKMLQDLAADTVARTLWGEYMRPDSLDRNIGGTAQFLPFLPQSPRSQLHLGVPADRNLYGRGRKFIESDTIHDGKYDLCTCIHANVTTEELLPVLVDGAIVCVLDYDFSGDKVEMIKFELALRHASRDKWLNLRDPIWIQREEFYPIYRAVYRVKK